jgi:HEAT repeat protein
MAIIKSKLAATAEDGVPQPRSREHLLRELGADDPARRRAAARELAGDGAAMALAERIRCEPLRSVREALWTAVVRLADAAALGSLAACLRSEDAALRNEAIDAMRQLPQVLPLVEELLADADPDVRIFAVNVLEPLRHAGVEALLRRVIDGDPHVNVCAAAADVLSEVATEQSRESLLRLKARFADEPYVHFAADLALGRLGREPR